MKRLNLKKLSLLQKDDFIFKNRKSEKGRKESRNSSKVHLVMDAGGTGHQCSFRLELEKADEFKPDKEKS